MLRVGEHRNRGPNLTALARANGDPTENHVSIPSCGKISPRSSRRGFLTITREHFSLVAQSRENTSGTYLGDEILRRLAKANAILLYTVLGAVPCLMREEQSRLVAGVYRWTFVFLSGPLEQKYQPVNRG